MDLREFIAESMARTRRATLEMVRDLSPAHLSWRPGPEANPIAFLLFHIFRVEDRYFHRWLSPLGEVWEREGWFRRWALPPHPPDPDPRWTTGNGWTPQEVAGWTPPPLEDLLAYGEVVRRSALAVLKDLDLRRLPEEARPDRPDFTVARYLYLASHHEAHHQGQIDYIRGLLRRAPSP